MFRQPLPGFRLDLAVPATGMVADVSANGGAMLVRRDRLLELGGFDETMFMDFEDIDLCWRAWLRGWESVYVPMPVSAIGSGSDHRGGRKRACARRITT